MEEEDLFNELQALPRFALIRRLNDLIKRAKAVKVRKTLNTTYSVPSLNTPQVHSTIIGYLRSQMPMIGKDSKKKEIIKHLDRVFTDIGTEFNIPAADFPDPGNFAEKLKKMDFTKFPAYDKAMMDKVDKMLSEDFPRLMKMIPAEAWNRKC